MLIKSRYEKWSTDLKEISVSQVWVVHQVLKVKDFFRGHLREGDRGTLHRREMTPRVDRKTLTGSDGGRGQRSHSHVTNKTKRNEGIKTSYVKVSTRRKIYTLKNKN